MSAPSSLEDILLHDLEHAVSKAIAERWQGAGRPSGSGRAEERTSPLLRVFALACLVLPTACLHCQREAGGAPARAEGSAGPPLLAGSWRRSEADTTRLLLAPRVQGVFDLAASAGLVGQNGRLQGAEGERGALASAHGARPAAAVASAQRTQPASPQTRPPALGSPSQPLPNPALPAGMAFGDAWPGAEDNIPPPPRLTPLAPQEAVKPQPPQLELADLHRRLGVDPSALHAGALRACGGPASVGAGGGCCPKGTASWPCLTPPASPPCLTPPLPLPLVDRRAANEAVRSCLQAADKAAVALQLAQLQVQHWGGGGDAPASPGGPAGALSSPAKAPEAAAAALDSPQGGEASANGRPQAGEASAPAAVPKRKRSTRAANAAAAEASGGEASAAGASVAGGGRGQPPLPAGAKGTGLRHFSLKVCEKVESKVRLVAAAAACLLVLDMLPAWSLPLAATPCCLPACLPAGRHELRGGGKRAHC